MPRARRYVAAACGQLPQDEVDKAVLLTSELVTNAVLHAHTPIEVCVHAGAGIRVEVSDRDPTVPVRRAQTSESLSGRGLEIVELLAASCGVVDDAEGKTLWFTVGLPADPDAVAGGFGGLDGDAVPTPRRTVRLHGLPVGLYEVARTYDQALLREYVMVVLDRLGSAGPDVSDVTTAGIARLVISDAVDRRLTQGVPASGRIDVSVPVSASDADAMVMLRRVLDAADAVAASGVLLTRPALPEVRSVREWCISEVLRQLDGGPPTPWQQERVVSDRDESLRTPIALDWLTSLDEPAVAVDTDNRVVAASAGLWSLLGWDAGDLIGLRVTELMPPDLRPTHSAAFTHHLVTGARHVLNGPLEVPAWSRDGRQVPVRLSVHKHAYDGTLYFVGYFARLPVADGDDARASLDSADAERRA